MKAKVTGMTTWQDTPTSGTLRIWPAERYEDGNGNATPGRYDFALNVGAKAWRDEHNSAADAYVVVAAPGEPQPVLAVFEETFLYANGARVVNIYRRLLVASDLNGTDYNYVEPQSVVAYTGSEPLTMQAARQLLLEGQTLIAAQQIALEATVESTARANAAADKLGAAGLVYVGNDPDGSANLLVLGTSSGATLTYANEAVPLVTGTISVPTLVIA